MATWLSAVVLLILSCSYLIYANSFDGTNCNCTLIMKTFTKTPSTTTNPTASPTSKNTTTKTPTTSSTTTNTTAKSTTATNTTSSTTAKPKTSPKTATNKTSSTTAKPKTSPKTATNKTSSSTAKPQTSPKTATNTTSSTTAKPKTSPKTATNKTSSTTAKPQTSPKTATNKTSSSTAKPQTSPKTATNKTSSTTAKPKTSPKTATNKTSSSTAKPKTSPKTATSKISSMTAKPKTSPKTAISKISSTTAKPKTSPKTATNTTLSAIATARTSPATETNATSSATTRSKTLLSSTSNGKRKRRSMISDFSSIDMYFGLENHERKRREVERNSNIASTTASLENSHVDDNVSTIYTSHTTDVDCLDYCKHRFSGMNSSSIITTPLVTSKTQTHKPTTLTTPLHPSLAPDWDAARFKISLTVVVIAVFNKELNDISSPTSLKYIKDFKTSLEGVYNNTPGFDRIEITGFSNGSVECDYNLIMEAKRNKTSLDEAVNYINDDVRQKVENLYIPNVGQVNSTSTRMYMKKNIKHAREEIKKGVCELFKTKICRFDHDCYTVDNDPFGQPYCDYKCNDKTFCGEHGDCYVDYSGNKKCRCKDDSLYVYHGDKCKQAEEKLLLSTTYIIAIAGGGGGAIVFIILIALICICCKWNKAKKASQFYQYKNRAPRDRESVAYKDDTGMQMESSRIENVPMGGYGHDNHSYVLDSAPSTGGQNMRYDKGRYYRVVKDPELGSDTMIYQPSNMNTPILRESNMSRDDFPSISDPLDSHYNYIDTETVYKIRRPQLGSMDSDRHGHPRTVL